MAKMKITKRNIDAIPTPAKQIEYRDTAMIGFTLIAYPSGRKQFTARCRIGDVRRCIKIGDYGKLTPDEARSKAKTILAKVEAGIDPRIEEQQKRKMPTFAQWAEIYLEDVKRRKKQPRSDITFLNKAVERFGEKKLDKVTRGDIKSQMEQLEKVGETAVTANRYHSSVRACLQEAVRSGLVATNVAVGIRHYPEPTPRNRTLSDEEMARLLDTLEAMSDLFAKTAIYMMIETGARKTEVLSAKWEDILFDDGLWRLPNTKAGRPQVIPLSQSIMARLRLLPRTDSPQLFAGDGKTGHLVDLKKPWNQVREAAELTKTADKKAVTMHDVRRTFGLHIARTAGLHMASKLLRHSSIKVTEAHYAPLGIDEMRAALEKPEAKVIPMQQVNAA